MHAMQDGLTALHIACNNGMSGMVSRLLLTAKEQKRFCQRKGSKKNSDCEDVINAKERPHVRICKCCFCAASMRAFLLTCRGGLR